MVEAKRQLAKKVLPPDQWPCTRCWGDGCDYCRGEGIVPRAVFSAWYRRSVEAREKALLEHQAACDRSGQHIVGENFYDLEWLRKFNRS